MLNLFFNCFTHSRWRCLSCSTTYAPSSSSKVEERTTTHVLSTTDDQKTRSSKLGAARQLELALQPLLAAPVLTMQTSDSKRCASLNTHWQVYLASMQTCMTALQLCKVTSHHWYLLQVRCELCSMIPSLRAVIEPASDSASYADHHQANSIHKVIT